MQRAGAGADAARIADVLVSTWQQVDIALSPILGQRGVAALYQRSLHLASASHPWLAGTQQGLATAMDLHALKTAIAQRSPADAAAAAGDLLQTFHELMDSLVGPSLTERLLLPVRTHLSSATPAQDTSP